MGHILLGSFGNADWLPLISPLVAFVVLYYMTTYFIKSFRKWKQNRQIRPQTDETFEAATEEH